MKTNAARILDQKKLKYRLATYEVDESDLSATSVAKKVGMPPEQVFKTLLVRGDKTGVFFVMLAAHEALDPKALASVTGNKKVELVALKEVLPLTGYIRGGVSPLGAKKAYSVVLDETALQHAEFAFSAGARGAQIVADPKAIQALLNAQLARVGRPAEADEPE